MRRIILLSLAVLFFASIALTQGPNEENAVGVMRSINTAEDYYSKTYAGIGYACELGTLGSDPKGGTASAKFAGLLDGSVTSGKERQGYKYKIDCKQKVKPQIEYVSFAIPVNGGRTYCSDQTGIIRWTAGEAKKCITEGQMVK